MAFFKLSKSAIYSALALQFLAFAVYAQTKTAAPDVVKRPN
jgi:hypothetical protein